MAGLTGGPWRPNAAPPLRHYYNQATGQWVPLNTGPVLGGGGGIGGPTTPPPPVSGGVGIVPPQPPPGVNGTTVPPGPTSQVPLVTPPPKPAAIPTFQPVQPTTDPQMAQLIAALTKQIAGASDASSQFQRQLSAKPSADVTPRAVERTPLVSTDQQQALEARILALLSGEGPDVGDVSTDPEARAYRLARTREGELERQEEAEALAASGLSGSGDFESRRFQLGERRAEDIAGFEAGLSGRRRREMTDTALRAAGLSLSDLTRQAALEESRGMTGERAEDRRLMAALEQARLRQSGAASAGQLALGAQGQQIQGTQGLLGILGGEAARKDQIGIMNQQLGAEIAFRQAQLEQASQDLSLRRDMFRSDAEFRQAQMALQQQMFDLQKLKEELERQLLEEELKRQRKAWEEQYGGGRSLELPTYGGGGAGV